MNSPNDPNPFPNYNDPLSPTSYSSEFPYNTVHHHPTTRPPVVGWYKVYAVFMAILYAVCFIGGAFLLRYKDLVAANVPDTTGTELMVNAVLLIAIGIPLFVLYGVALILPNKPWAWIYHIIMIAIGLTSCCTWLITIPLLVFWLKPETQAYFGRDRVSTPSSPITGPPPPIPSV